MDFRQLEYIITIAQEKTLLNAAERLFLTPSALSQHVSRLEEELHTPLFKRTKQGWIPTYAGKVYIEMAQDILQRQKRARLQISDIADSKVGHFVVGVTAGRGTLMFSQLFPKFKAEYPDVKVGLFEGTVAEISERITAGKVDIGFLSNVLDCPNLASQTQATEEIVLVVPRSHPMAKLADKAEDGKFVTVDLKKFEQDEFLLAGEGTTMRTLENRIFMQAGFVPKVAFEATSLLTLNLLAKGGYGISFIPRFYAEKTENAVYFRISPAPKWKLIAAYRKDHYITRAENYFISLVSEYYSKKD